MSLSGVLSVLVWLILLSLLAASIVVFLKILKGVVTIKRARDAASEESNQESKGGDNDDDEKTEKASPGYSDLSYWDDADFNMTNPSLVKYSCSAGPFLLRKGPNGALFMNGSYLGWSYMTETLEDCEDPRLFRLHFFDLKNHPPSAEDSKKHQLARKESYAMLESVSGAFMYSNADDGYAPQSAFFGHRGEPPEETNHTDDRFFKVLRNGDQDKITLVHYMSNCVVASVSGFVKPRVILVYFNQNNPDYEFVLEKWESSLEIFSS
uniref:Wsv457-like protein n=1 Tax=Sicyonia whispovirus TaxID=2984283 RepID=A0A9C7C9C3_9VIRU|nr:MAG: wsv457-like protein [Sicyonia whispovirus]